MTQYSEGTKWSCSEKLLPDSCLEPYGVFPLETMNFYLLVYNSSFSFH